MFCSFLATLGVCKESWILEIVNLDIVSTHVRVHSLRNEKDASAEHAPEQMDMPMSWICEESESECEGQVLPAVPTEIDNTLSDETLVVQRKHIIISKTN